MARRRNPKSSAHPAKKPGLPGTAVRDSNQGAVNEAVRTAVDQLNRGDIQGASATLERGLRLAPDHPDLLHLMGQVTLHLGDIEGGKGLIRRAIRIAPKISLYHYNLGNALFAQDDYDGALECFRQAVRLDPRSADAYTNLGIVFTKKQRYEEADAAFAEAARLQPNNPQVLLNLALCNVELRRPEKVSELIGRVEALVGRPEPRLLHEIGNVYRGLGRHLIAEDYYRRALQLKEDAPEIWFALGDVLSQAGEHERAIEALQRAETLGFFTGPVKLALARVATDRGEVAKAKGLLAEAAEASRDNRLYLARIANQYTLLGDFEAQEKCLSRVLEIDPENVAAFAGLAFAPGRKLSEQEALRLGRLAEDKGVDADTRKSIGFALGDYYRHARRFDDSFRYYRLGNRMKGYSFDRAAYSQWLNAVEATFTREFFAAREDWGSDARMPVLIVGMPRSGTTLTEQILSSHPAVFGAGEYRTVAALAAVDGRPPPDFRNHLDLATALSRTQVAEHATSYLEKMRALAKQDERFVTNKLPHNFQQLGLFGMLFPRAPIIHINRDPRDTLLSIYFQDFAGFHDYAYDLKTLGIYYRLYERLMTHWTRVIPNPVYLLQYEDLVADLPGKTRELADFIGVDWDERMLRFYEQDRKVDTASKWQVRQPLYTSSVGRWKPYERHLGPLFEALGPIGR